MKEKMRKNGFFGTAIRAAGMLAFALTVGLALAGCPAESGGGIDDSPQAPSLSDLPALPAGTTPIASEAEAIALQNAVSQIYPVIARKMANILSSKKGSAYNWNFSNETAAGAEEVKLTSNGAIVIPTSVEANQNVYDSINARTKAVLTADVVSGSTKAVNGSKMERKAEYSERFTLVSMNPAVAKNFNVSSNIIDAIGLTVVTAENKSARIIVYLRGIATYSNSGPFSISSLPNIPYTYSGSLNVYGSGNSPVYTLAITNEAAYNQVLAYFGGTIAIANSGSVLDYAVSPQAEPSLGNRRLFNWFDRLILTR